jgi:molybdate transport system permease protein
MTETIKTAYSAPSPRIVVPSLGKISLLGVSSFTLALLGLPVLVLALRGIGTRGWDGLPATGITEAFRLSIITTLISALLIALLGTPLAYILARWRFPLKRVLNLLIELPVVLPPAVAGLALLLTLGRRGLLGQPLESIGITLPFTTAGVIVAQVFIATPFYVRAAQLGFSSISREIEDAARVDGAGGLALFWRITLPLSFRALAAGLILSWARALGEFGATILFAGSLMGRTQTMPLLVYNVLERNLDAAIWTGVLLVGMALVALFISQFLVAKSPEVRD